MMEERREGKEGGKMLKTKERTTTKRGFREVGRKREKTKGREKMKEGMRGEE